MTTQPDKPKSRLSEILVTQAIRANQTAKDWEDATDQIGHFLVQAGCVDQAYVAAMKTALKEIGPYAVIAPGIVLLHARPENGVIHAGIGVMTLTTPVPFGHSENDPVDIVIALAATDKHSHIQALAELAGLLGNTSVLEKIRKAENDDQLFNALASS